MVLGQLATFIINSCHSASSKLSLIWIKDRNKIKTLKVLKVITGYFYDLGGMAVLLNNTPKPKVSTEQTDKQF